MAKDNNIVQYNLRLNLNNPYDLQLHRAILNASMDIYRSKNNYLRKIAYRGVFGDECDIDEGFATGNCSGIATMKDLEQLEERMQMWTRNMLLKEIFPFIGASLVNKSTISANEYVRTNEEEEIEEEIDEAVVEAALAYFGGD